MRKAFGSEVSVWCGTSGRAVNGRGARTGHGQRALANTGVDEETTDI